MFKNLPENVRLSLVSIIPLFVVMILFVLVGKLGLSKISEIRAKVQESEKVQVTLSQKLDILTTLEATAVNGAAVSVVAFPNDNPLLVVVSQLKNLALQNQLTLSNIKTTLKTSTASELSQADIGFEVVGSRLAVMDFLNGISGFAPITLLDKIKMDEFNGLGHANVSVKTFWAPLPSKLPALTERVDDLNSSEKELLQSIQNLAPSQFTEVPPSEGDFRPNPFTP